jgi:anti-sigma regulatory factor (Ser/Thr protein kinase)
MTPSTPRISEAPRRTPARRTLVIPADLAALAPVRRALAEALERRGWSRDDAWRVLLAVQEALVNAVEHGSTAGDAVEVRFAVRRDRAQVWLRDAGRPGAAPPSGPVAAPPPGQTHGRGRLIMRALADGVESRPAGSGTQVGLAFLRRPDAPASHGAKAA